jgi:hypothetical protein
MMLSFARLQALAGLAGIAVAMPFLASAQTNYYSTSGGEYAPIGQLPGDQMHPDAAISTTGGFVVWQDKVTDGSGWGVSTRQLDGTLSGNNSTFRVNVTGTNDQENPHVALLKNGGAVFVWQGGQPGFQHIYARFMASDNTFTSTNDILVNTLPATNKYELAYSYTTNTVTTITTNRNALHKIKSYATNTVTTVTTKVATNYLVSAIFQINPAVAVLNNSNVVVVWASYNEAAPNSMQDVYGQLFSPAGKKIGTEFLVNQFTSYNQRTPAVTALTNGGFAVAWVSEQERSLAPNLGSNTTYQHATDGTMPSVDIYARLYNSNAVAVGNEFLVNTDANPCATPGLATAADGSIMVVWSAHDSLIPTNSWDIYARPFNSAGTGGSVVRVNTHLYGDQFSPKVSSINQEFLVVWVSLQQDGDREGVFGQFVHSDGSLIGGEFRVNTTTISQQMQPAVVTDGTGQFEVVWTSYGGQPYGFDLYAQRYADVSALLLPMSAPFVYAPFNLSKRVYAPQLQVSWPAVMGITVSNYEIYVDGSTKPIALVCSNQWVMQAVHGLLAKSTHSFQVGYVLSDGRRAPLSPSASGSTWSGLNWDGVPYEWMAKYYGGYANDHYTTNFWPGVNKQLAAGGLTLAQVFLSGGNPLNAGTWLHSAVERTGQGMFLHWNTQPGATYQVQVSTNFNSWTTVGSPRFAAGAIDSIYIGGGSVGYYRVVLLR